MYSGRLPFVALDVVELARNYIKNNKKGRRRRRRGRGRERERERKEEERREKGCVPVFLLGDAIEGSFM